ncbi:TPA: thioredoxin-disulfide reductase [Candidatus Woesearchaeota archaeon]|nr:thioredoxin-disulfide reductase [Candidatus Woesearchaeota archaeon]HII68241.1 thioredoxin-disulfide reductase [Candidatus Woesearchaeota archaeon]
MENIVIIGTGSAGLTAAIYTARANLSPLVLTGNEDGGQLMLTSDVENFPGFPEGIQGPLLMESMKQQAKRFGARFVTSLAKSFAVNPDGTITVTTSDAKPIQAISAIIATGASARWLNIESEKQYKSRGIHTCATCDGAFYKGKDIMVVGGGDSACEEATFLTRFATKVYIVHRRDALRASKVMAERTLRHQKIEPIWDSAIVSFAGDGKRLTGVVLKNLKTMKTKLMKIDGVFIAIGHVPNTGIFKGLIELDEHGFIVPKGSCVGTNVPGVFAAGDVADKKYKQAITAAGTGCMAALEAEKYVEGWKEKGDFQ